MKPGTKVRILPEAFHEDDGSLRFFHILQDFNANFDGVLINEVDGTYIVRSTEIPFPLYVWTDEIEEIK